MGEVIVSMEKEVSGFKLTYKYNLRLKQHALQLRSLVGGSHFADHTRYNLLEDDGTIIESRPITSDVARFIIDNFESRGSTASFDIYKTDLEAGRILPRDKPSVGPQDVRHKLTVVEQSYTATGAKLAHH